MSDEEGGDDNNKAEAGCTAFAAPALVTGRWALRQVAQPLLRTALVLVLRGSQPETCVVHGNKYTGLLNAVPMRVRRQFWPAQFESNEISYMISHMMSCREHVMAYDVVCDVVQRT